MRYVFAIRPLGTEELQARAPCYGDLLRIAAGNISTVIIEASNVELRANPDCSVFGGAPAEETAEEAGLRSGPKRDRGSPCQ